MSRSHGLLLSLLVSSANGFALSPKPLLRAPLHVQHRPAQLARLPAQPAMVSERTVVAFALNTALAGMGVAKGQKVLTPLSEGWKSGLAHAWALGVMLWASLGWRGWAVGVFYLVGGAIVTKVKKAKKEKMGIAEGRGGMRGPENVWGSAATGAACALATMAYPARSALLRMCFVCAFATKLSDTCASEIGKAYGTKTYMITTLRECKPGDEGGVSLEGTAAGVGGSIALTLFATLIGVISGSAVLPLLLAAFIATNIESLIGAAAQDDYKWLTNEVVNFIMTVIGAALAAAFGIVLKLA